MKADPELERIVRSWLREDRQEDAERLLFALLADVDTTPQRQAGWLARRIPFMNNKSIRYGTAAAVVIAAALLGASFLPRNVGTPEATPSPSARPLAGTTQLVPGTYFVHEDFPVRITFTVPTEGWHNYVWERGAASANTRALCSRPNCDPPDAAGVGFHRITGLPADACNPGFDRLDVGPTIEDLADAFADQPRRIATDPVETTLGDFPAMYLELSVDPEQPVGCGTIVSFYASNFTRGLFGGESQRLWIVDVDGTRLVIEAFDFPGTPDEAVQAATDIVESIEFTP